MFKVIRKADILLFIILIIVGLISGFILATGNTRGSKAIVTINGKVYGTYSLAENRTVDLKSGNILSISNGYVYMKDASCKGRDCVHQGKINKTSERIVCLPHKVVVEIKGGSKEYDSISK